ncbi:hypothetical protein CHU98_g11035 [Xylaria longipes]|nr:hypothetical protein CHU98_g11035 [Xylaria longipes]
MARAPGCIRELFSIWESLKLDLALLAAKKPSSLLFACTSHGRRPTAEATILSGFCQALPTWTAKWECTFVIVNLRHERPALSPTQRHNRNNHLYATPVHSAAYLTTYVYTTHILRIYYATRHKDTREFSCLATVICLDRSSQYQGSVAIRTIKLGYAETCVGSDPASSPSCVARTNTGA